MSERLIPDLESRLATWLADRAADEVPKELIARVVAIPVASSRAGARWTPLSSSTRRGSAFVALAAAIVVAVGLALIVAARFDGNRPAATPLPQSPLPGPTMSSSNPSSPTPSPAHAESFRGGGLLPDAIPGDVAHGTVDTAIGRARWVHLTGDASTLPDPLTPMLGPGRTLVWFDGGGADDICFNGGSSRPECVDPPGPSLWVAGDLLAERDRRSLPIDAKTGSLWPIGDSFWFVTADPVSVWRSDDLETWQQTDLSALRSPGAASLAWTISPGFITVVNGHTVAPFTFAVNDPGSLLGYSGQPVRLARNEQGEYVAREFHSMRDGGDVDLGAITPVERDAGLDFLNAAGALVGRVEGVGLEFAQGWERHGISAQLVAYLDGDRWLPAALPDGPLGDAPLVIDLDGAFLAFGLQADGSVREWRSRDGQSWTSAGTLADDKGTALKSNGVSYRDEPGGFRTLVAPDIDGSAGWISRDGASWMRDTEGDQPVPPAVLASGLIRTGDQTDDGLWLVSSDGSTWEPAPQLAAVITKTTPAGAGGTSESVLDNVLFFSVDEMGGPRDLWMVEFEQPPR